MSKTKKIYRKTTLYYVLYHDKATNELIFNPYKSNYKKIIINLKNLKVYKKIQYPKNFSFVDIDKDDYKKVENNIGWVLKEIFRIVKKLKGEDIQKGYKALEKIKYLIKDSAFAEEQELRILKIVPHNEIDTLDVDYEIKSAYKDYFEAVSYNALTQIIFGSKIDNVHSVAEAWRTHIKKEEKKDTRYEGIEVSVSDAPFN